MNTQVTCNFIQNFYKHTANCLVELGITGDSGALEVETA